ncbi:hypothetical protein [Amycolatopsis jejuensis]|uniref:hypothetical protein n=1 Tax=Amycolatopsis jejuensis TaxID=330084 RepID=UPI000527A6E6|nr:hypothetical protein [Amycolatopsis jejuensis]
MEIKRHDLEPALVMDVADAAGVADLRQVVAWRVLGELHGQLVVDGAPDTVVIDPATPWKAVLTRRWQAGETAETGDVRVEVEAMWPGSRPQTFPPSSYETVRIKADLG